MIDVPLVVWVVVGGVVVIVYDVAPNAGVHVKSMVVRLALLGVRFVTAAGLVRMDDDVVESPDPNSFVAVTVNV